MAYCSAFLVVAIVDGGGDVSDADDANRIERSVSDEISGTDMGRSLWRDRMHKRRILALFDKQLRKILPKFGKKQFETWIIGCEIRNVEMTHWPKTSSLEEQTGFSTKAHHLTTSFYIIWEPSLSNQKSTVYICH